MKPIVVQKYGGSSVATTEKICEVASLIKQRIESGFRLCVVVSAMGKTTDELLHLAKEISKNPSRRELDMLLSCGERASMALLAMALQEIGVPSISFTGSQSGIITDDVHSGAHIVEVKPNRVRAELENDKVVIVAGFQGVSLKKEITTLGRGGSDTTAVALAAALDALACEIYSDVAGIYTADPRIVSDAQLMNFVSFDQMLDLSSAGAKVLNHQAVAFAKNKGIQIHARKTGDTCSQTIISDRPHQNTAIAHRDWVYTLELDSKQLPSQLKQLESAGHIEIIGNSSILISIAPEDAHHLEALGFNTHLGTISIISSNSLVLVAKALELDLKATYMSMSSTKATFWLLRTQISETVKLLHTHCVKTHAYLSEF